MPIADLQIIHQKRDGSKANPHPSPSAEFCRSFLAEALAGHEFPTVEEIRAAYWLRLAHAA